MVKFGAAGLSNCSLLMSEVTRTKPGGGGCDGLKEAGLIDGHNVAIEFRWAENKFDRLPALAAELVQRQVAVILGPNIIMRAARAATSTIPIVFVSGGDPIESGLVTNLSRPGGNITGVSFASAPPQPKRLGLLHELV